MTILTLGWGGHKEKKWGKMEPFSPFKRRYCVGFEGGIRGVDSRLRAGGLYPLSQSWL